MARWRDLALHHQSRVGSATVSRPTHGAPMQCPVSFATNLVLLALACVGCRVFEDETVAGPVGPPDATVDAPSELGDPSDSDDGAPTPPDAADFDTPELPVCTPHCDGAGCQDGCGGVCNGLPCDDSSACTALDTCTAGTCLGADACDDSNPCTGDVCDALAGCAHSSVTGPCEDGNACTQGDACQDGACVPGGGRALRRRQRLHGRFLRADERMQARAEHALMLRWKLLHDGRHVRRRCVCGGQGHGLR
jgi:hypothetical protein